MTAGNLERFSVQTDQGRELATAPTFAAARRAAEVLLEESEAEAVRVFDRRFVRPFDRSLVCCGRWTRTETGIQRRF